MLLVFTVGQQPIRLTDSWITCVGAVELNSARDSLLEKKTGHNTEKDHTQRTADVIYNVFVFLLFFFPPKKRHLEMQLWKQQVVF